MSRGGCSIVPLSAVGDSTSSPVRAEQGGDVIGERGETISLRHMFPPVLTFSSFSISISSVIASSVMAMARVQRFPFPMEASRPRSLGREAFEDVSPISSSTPSSSPKLHVERQPFLELPIFELGSRDVPLTLDNA